MDETEAPARTAEPQGGDPVCWLTHVCPGCGRMNEEAGPPCEECGLADWPGA